MRYSDTENTEGVGAAVFDDVEEAVVVEGEQARRVERYGVSGFGVGACEGRDDGCFGVVRVLDDHADAVVVFVCDEDPVLLVDDDRGRP